MMIHGIPLVGDPRDDSSYLLRCTSERVKALHGRTSHLCRSNATYRETGYRDKKISLSLCYSRRILLCAWIYFAEVEWLKFSLWTVLTGHYPAFVGYLLIWNERSTEGAHIIRLMLCPSVGPAWHSWISTPYSRWRKEPCNNLHQLLQDIFRVLYTPMPPRNYYLLKVLTTLFQEAASKKSPIGPILIVLELKCVALARCH